MEHYQYTALVTEEKSFRLMRLLAGCSTDPLKCELFDKYLNNPISLIDYDALSYAWDSRDMPLNMQVDGALLPVTANLFNAVSALRIAGEDRILWIDAICINQNDKKERGHQVRQMASIYRTARAVVVWLGLATPYTDTILDKLKVFRSGCFERA